MLLCARAGCDAPATATVAFDSERRMVSLDHVGAPGSPHARAAGDVCERHATRLVPPRGWGLLDLRGPSPTLWPRATTPEPPPRGTRPPRAPGRRRPRGARGSTLPVGDATGEQPPARPEPALDATWSPRFDPDDDLEGLLRASSPLLARAFRLRDPH